MTGVNHFHTIFLLIASLGLSACQAGTGRLENNFDPVAAQFVKTNGDATIAGQAFLRTTIGEVRYAAGSEVTLIPVTAYSMERIGKIYESGKCTKFGKNFSNDDPNYQRYTRKSKANGEGRFAFKGISPGKYFVVTSIFWQIPGSYISEGCGLYETATITGSETVEVIISGT